MNLNQYMRRALALMSMLIFAAALHGQGSTTAALSGRVLSGDSPVSGAEVRLTFGPTNSVYTTVSDASGRYSLGGLRVGGPYTLLISSSGYRSTVEEGISLSLSQTLRIETNLDSSEDVVELEAFEVVARPSTIFDSDRFGSGSVIAGDAVQLTPSVNENVADIVRLNPLITVMDPERLEINAAGQHFRQNSVQVDGVNLNDQFGLEATGFPSLLNPFPLRTIEQFSVSVSPYDVRSSGFTGALINAVTKSGTNEFEGEAYYLYSDNGLRADNYETGDDSFYESNTYGISLGGPIIKDKLFFFVNYEKAEIEREASNPGFIPDAGEVQRLRDYLSGLSTTAYPTGYDPGGWGSAGTLLQEDEKILAKIDWVINDQHRMSVRYSQTEATEPLFGEYDDFGETALTSHYYTNAFKNTAFAAQVNSRWSDMIETEVSVARDTFDKAPTYNNPNLFPQIIIDKFPGTSADGSSSTNSELFFGSEDSRQANDLATETIKGKAAATIYLGKHTLVVGFDYEETEFENTFLQDVYGDIEFDTLDQLVNDEIIEQSFNSSQPFMARKTGVVGESIPAASDYADLGLFIQDTWQVTSQLEVLFGLRYDMFSTDENPAANPDFNSTFTTQSGMTGFDNTNTIDGADQFSVRAGFKYDLETSNRQQIRGGFGLFQGRVPGVYLSNAFSNNGATTSVIDYDTGAYAGRVNNAGDTVDGLRLTEYLNNEFDPNNPIISVASPSGSQVDLIDRDFELPSVWKANIAYDYEIPSTNITFTVEALQTWTNQGVYVENLNLNQVATTPDGRAYYDGDNWFDGNFGEVYNLKNTNKGEAFNLSFALSRPMINNWSFSASYTYGDSTDVSSVTSSTAGSNYGNRAVFNGNEDVEATSNYETKHRFLVQYAYQKQWNERNKSTFSMVYEGRSGRPYSYIFDGDFNNDDRFGNDLFYVPTGQNDPNISFAAGTTQQEIDDFFAYIDSQEGLRKYKGRATERNSGVSDWIDRVDIRVAHSVMVTDRVELEVWFAVQNFLNLLNEDWGQTVEIPFNYTSEVAGGEFITDTAAANFNTIEYDLGSSPQRPEIDNDRNYSIVIGGALKF